MIVDINKLIYPERNYNENIISEDNFIFTSYGNDLEVEIPSKVSNNQLNEVKNILRQLRQFEYEYDTFVFMPYNSTEIINEANDRISEETLNDDDEVIIGLSSVKKNK